MDKFTRIYSISLVAIALVVIGWMLYESPDVSQLNSLLSENTEIASYPYKFRVIKLDNGVATMTTPRTADFPAYRALAILFPELSKKSPDSPAMLEAQQEMARVQGIAQKTVSGSKDVNRVTWEIDENWLRSKGIDPGQL